MGDVIKVGFGESLQIGDVIQIPEMGDGWFKVTGYSDECGWHVTPCDEDGNEA